MQKIFAGLLAFFLPFAMHAQTVTASLELGRKSPLPRFFEYCPADGGLVTFGNMTKKSSRYLGLFKYDENFEKQWSKQVIQQNGRKNIDFLSVLGENVYVFVSEYYPKERSIKTFYQHYDLDGKRISENNVISTLPNEKEHRVDLKYELSINKKNLLCYKNLNQFEANEKLLFTLFSGQGEDVLSGELEIPYADNKFEVRKVQVSNTGTIYILGKFYKVTRVKDPDDFYFMLVKYRPQDGKVQEIPFDFGDRYITDLTFKVDRNENVYAAGFFSNRSSHEIVGTVYKKLNANNEEEVSSHQKFTEDFLSRFLSDRQINRGQELKYFYLDNIVLRSDGGVLLVAEKYYTTFNSYLDIYGYWVDQKIHHYDEIIINSVSNTGELEWSSVVPKRQSSENKQSLSYIDIISGSNIFLVYEYRPKKSPRSIYYNTVTMGGKVSERRPLVDLSLKNITFYPRSSEQISNSEAILIYFYDRDKVFNIAKMAFD